VRTIITIDRPRVKPSRKTPRAVAAFGSGILRSVPHDGPRPYTQADLVEAVRMFEESREREQNAGIDLAEKGGA
jgi:hypothetical protein